MSQIGNIAINDGQSSPVTHTFLPLRSGDKSTWRENQGSLALVGQGTVDMTVKQGQLCKLRLVLDLPALETATGANSAGYTAAPKVAYSNKAIVEMFLPARGTAQQRKDLRVLLSNLLLDAIVLDSIENLNVPY